MSSIPRFRPEVRKLFRFTSTSADVLAATATCSLLMVFWETIVPVAGETLNMFTPVGPGVKASSVSAPFPKRMLPAIIVSLID